MEYIFGFCIAAQYLVSLLKVDFLRQAEAAYLMTAAVVLILASFIIWKQRTRWIDWLRPRYLQAGNPDTSGIAGIAILFVLELFYLTAGFLLPRVLYPELSMGKTDLYIALTAEVCMILLLVLSRLDIALAGEKKPPFWPWRIMPVSTLAIIWVLQHHWNPGWPKEPWAWAQNMVLIFLVELICNLGIRGWLSRRAMANELRGAGRKNRRRGGVSFGTVILAFIVIIGPIDLPHVMRVRLDHAGTFLSWAVFLVQLMCMVWFFWKRPVWSKRLMERSGQGKIVSMDKIVDSVQSAFLIFCLLFFGNILPYALYMDVNYYKSEIMWMTYWAVDLWICVFGSPLYLVLTGAKEMPPMRYRFPWLSFAGTVWAVWNFPLPYDPMRCAILILSVYLLESIVLLTWKYHEEKRRWKFHFERW